MKKSILKYVLLMFVSIFVQNIYAQNKKVKSVNYNEITKAGSFTEYVSKNGNLISVGDTLQIGNPTNNDRFAHITQNDGYLRADKVNKKLIVKAINVSGDVKKGYNIYFTMKGLGATPVFLKYEEALEVNEISTVSKDTLQ